LRRYFVFYKKKCRIYAAFGVSQTPIITRLLKGAHESALFFLEDTITSVKISKVDIADGEELEGATIQLIDKDKCRGGALRL